MPAGAPDGSPGEQVCVSAGGEAGDERVDHVTGRRILDPEAAVVLVVGGGGAMGVAVVVDRIHVHARGGACEIQGGAQVVRGDVEPAMQGALELLAILLG